LIKKILLPLCVAFLVVFNGLPVTAYASDRSTPDFASLEPSSKPNLYFDHLTAADGLSFSIVYSILQDQQGFMWFGTRYGLNKYDGLNFTMFNLAIGSSDPWFGNGIRFLYQDQIGNLWIGTYLDLVRRDSQSGSFIHYTYGVAIPGGLGEWPVNAICEDSAGYLWVAGHNGLYRYEPSTDTFSNYIKIHPVNNIYCDRQGGLWLGTDSGLLHSQPGSLDQEDPTFEPIDIGNAYITVIQEDKQGALWVGTYGAGIKRLDRSTGHITSFQNDPQDPNSLSSDYIFTILQDDSNRLWVGSDKGLDLFDPTTGGFFHYHNDLNDPHSLSSDSVFDLYQDHSGVIWIATSAGINKLNETASSIIRYQRFSNTSGVETSAQPAGAADPQGLPSLSDTIVEAVYEDSHGFLWIGTATEGLNRLDRATGTVTVFRPDPADAASISSGEVIAIYEDKAGNLWFGSSDGLDRFDPRTETFEHIGVFGRHAVSTIIEDAQGNLWVGYWGGLLRGDGSEPTHTFTYPKPIGDLVAMNRVAKIYQDRTGTLWISTQDDGLYRMDPAKGSESDPAIVHFPLEENDPKNPGPGYVMDFYEDAQGVLWMGSMQYGLVRYERDSRTFTRYMPNTGKVQYVSCIQGDAQGYLWVGTTLGVARFDSHSETFLYFDSRDGLVIGETLTCHQNKQGEMFFGGLQGLIAFSPNQIHENLIPPPVLVTALYLKNQVLRTDLPPNEQIKLSYQENYLSFDFVALDYTAPAKNQYAYKMEGLDADWVDASPRRHADYPALKPGAYTFRVKASNNSGVWNEQGAAVHITITPPFWQTWWFLGLVGVAFVGLIAGGIRLRLKGLEARSRDLEKQVSDRTGALEQKTLELQQHTQEIERRRQELETLLEENARLSKQAQDVAVLEERSRLARELHDAVTQTLFSASLVAEAVPITWEKDPQEGRGLLQELRNLSRGALAEMRTLLMELRPAALLDTSLGNLVRQLGEAASGKEGIPVNVQIEGDAELPPDVHIALYRITQEALNNVVKHARARQVTVRLCYTTEDQAVAKQTSEGEQPVESPLSVLLSIMDDGRGFDPAHISRERLGLGIMQERAKAIGASLTIDSQPGHGTQVTVLWKQEKNQETK
jgi:ligand-binding sensor domain-containing protein/signal transduction histidine kinase